MGELDLDLYIKNKDTEVGRHIEYHMYVILLNTFKRSMKENDSNPENKYQHNIDKK